MRRLAMLVLATAALGACSKRAEPSETGGATGTGTRDAPAPAAFGAQHLPRIALVVRHAGGARDTRLSIESALTPEQQEIGLMHRTGLKPGEGMIFPMIPPRSPSFWMKDTLVPIDMLFIRTDGSITKIAANATPGDEHPVFADMPVSGVLELAGGSAAALGISEGDHVNWGPCSLEKSPMPVSEPGNFCPAP